MGATLNSPTGRADSKSAVPQVCNLPHAPCRVHRVIRVLLTGAFCLLFLNIATVAADSPNPQPPTTFLARAKAAFEAAETAQSTNTDHLKANIDLARAAFDYADLAPNDHLREPVALHGIDAGRAATSLDPNSAAAHYYLALDLGQYARTKMLGALKILNEMERELKRAAELDPKLDYAGPNRTLGVLYLEAPGWPTSLGSKTKARQNLERALELAPEYPDNHLTLIEALQKLRDTHELPERLAAYEKLLPTARAKFTGPDWEDEWDSWDKRWKTIQSKQRKP
jgi:tetratricopeptide (TPR) repeat protein